MNVTNARGDILVRVNTGLEDDLLRPSVHDPMTHALVAARHQERFLFIFNRFRCNWELPGGRIEPGESPRTCAEREFFEETGQEAAWLRFACVMEFTKHPDRHTEYGVLYTTESHAVASFQPTDEVESTVLWDLRSHIGQVDEIDRALCCWLNRWGG